MCAFGDEFLFFPNENLDGAYAPELVNCCFQISRFLLSVNDLNKKDNSAPNVHLRFSVFDLGNQKLKEQRLDGPKFGCDPCPVISN